MKKIIMLLLSVCLSATFIFASGSTESKDEIPLEIASFATQDNQISYCLDFFGNLISEYNQENGTNYVLKFTSGTGADIINTRMSSNNKPDIFLLDSPADVQRYTKEDLLLDLTASSEKYGWNDKMFKWAYDLSIINDRVMALPMEEEGIVIWYDKSVADSIGVNPESITTLEQFEDALQKAQDNGYVPLMLGSQDMPWAQEWYLSVLYSYTGRDLLKSTIEGKSSWEDPRFKASVELYKSWHDKEYLANGKSYIITLDDAINAFLSHKALFKLEGTWAPWWMNSLTSEEQDNIGVMLHPAINENEMAHLPLAVGGMYCAAKDSAAKADVIGYIFDNLMKQENQGKFLELSLGIAPIKIEEETFSNMNPIKKEMWNLVNDALDDNSYGYTTYAFYPPETRVYSYEGIIEVLEENITIDDYLTKMQDLNQKELANGFIPILP